ncbi:MAG: hypothetical protein OXF23_05335 [Candidatus Dadabacteria bacterium]|nr:hypothetical protein [Candidatus Dadabacteria bacterium]
MSGLIEIRSIIVAVMTLMLVLIIGVFGLIQNSWEHERKLSEDKQGQYITEIAELKIALEINRRDQEEKINNLSSEIKRLKLEIEENNRKLQDIANKYKSERDRINKLEEQILMNDKLSGLL